MFNKKEFIYLRIGCFKTICSLQTTVIKDLLTISSFPALALSIIDFILLFIKV